MSEGESTENLTEGGQEFSLKNIIRTDVGMKRSENQDAHAWTAGEAGRLYLVADGMGGARGGATASALAVEVIAKASFLGGVFTPSGLSSAIEKANTVIFEASQRHEHLTGMGTTVVALGIIGSSAVIAHVGDSRIYRLTDGKLCQLTHDHTLVQELMDSGSLTAEQAENHPIAHMLTRSLGPTGAVDVEVQELEGEIRAGERFLLCCDGLYNMVKDEEIEEILSSSNIETAAARLIDLANERGGTDNITVQIVEAAPGVGSSSDSFGFETSSEHSFCDDRGSPLAEFDSILETLAEAEEEASSQSAYDSIIFDNQPTSEDIRRHERAVQGSSKGPTIQTSVPDGVIDRSETGDGVSSRDSLIIGFLALAVVLLSGVIITLVLREQSPHLQSQTAAKQRPLGETPKTEDESALREAQVEERGELLKQLEALEEQEATDSSLVEEEELGGTVVQYEGELAKAVAEASDIAVPPAPVAPVMLPEEVPDEPIVWEHEEHRKEQVEVPEPSPVEEEGIVPLVLSEKEQLEVIQKKSNIRGKISVLDGKLRAYSITAKDDLSARIAELEEKARVTEQAIETTSTNLERAKRRFEIWAEREKKANPKPTQDLAAEVSVSSTQVRRKKEAFDIATIRYLDAVEIWQETPESPEFASRMAQLGRELESRRVELEEAVLLAIDSAMKQIRFDLSEFSLVREDLRERQARLNREIGFLKGFSFPSSEQRIEQQRSLLDERRKLLKDLAELRSKVSDNEESGIRRDDVLKAYRLN